MVSVNGAPLVGACLLGLSLLLLLLLPLLPAAQAGAPRPTSPDLKKTKVFFDPKGLAKTVGREIEKAIPSEPQDEVILLNGQPECIRLSFDGEKISSDNNFAARHLLIFPLPKYAAQKTRERQESFDKQLRQLKTIIKTKAEIKGEAIPIFPQSDAAEVFHNQMHYLDFKNGSGVSFVASYANGDPPLKKDSQFYCFQGLSKDGRFYVSFFWPLTIESLPENLAIEKGVRYLSKLPRNKFKPDLDRLDRAVESLRIDD
ncbi:MAG: hypothetical protein KGS72_11195 [Cyanobacteria bacterium REEB67]|nr:hypothetical protein [Cyanobacteria bacterium REEB67]